MRKIDDHIGFARKLTKLLDTEFKVLGIKFGLDPVLSVVPGLGSMVGAFTSLYIFWIGFQIELPKAAYFKMGANILFDFLIGSVPIAGVIFDVFFKSNVKNLKIIEQYLDSDILKGEILS